MSGLFIKVLNMSIAAGWMILAVLILRQLMRKAPKWANCLLWALVAVRLVCPVSIESVLSLIPSGKTIPENIELMPHPAIDSGVTVINDAVNPVIAGSFTPDPASSANPLQIWVPVLAIVWIAGIAVMAVYAFVSWLKLKKSVAASVLMRGNVYICDDIGSPFILGVFRPRIYVPSSLKGQALESVLAHERAHLARHDHWWKPLAFAVLSVYWFHPLVWAAFIVFCRDIEMACDEKVIRDMDSGAIADYSQVLLSCSSGRRLISACPLAFGESAVKSRVRGILRYRKPGVWLVALSLVVCLGAAVCFMTDPASADDIGIPANASQLSETHALDPEIIQLIEDNKPQDLGMTAQEVADKYLAVSEDGTVAGFLGDASEAPLWLQDLFAVKDGEEAGAMPDVSDAETFDYSELISDGFWTWPTDSKELESLFGMRWGRMHYGLDIVNYIGKDVYAVKNGTVVSAGWQSGRGYTVEIEHGMTSDTRPEALKGAISIKSVYCHLDKILVEELQSVQAGAVIGTVGSSGNSTGPHLHLEVLVDGEPIDPLLCYETRQPAETPAQGDSVPAGETSEDIVKKSASDVVILETESVPQIQEESEKSAAENDVHIIAAKELDENGQPTGKFFVWPVDSTSISNTFGKKEYPETGAETFHNGVDIAAEKGANVYAAKDGTVVSAGWQNGRGYTIEIEHGMMSDTRPDGLKDAISIKSVYCHLDSITVKEGQSVRAGTLIGTVGATGLATGPHLHLEIQKDGEPVDPMQFFEEPE